MEKRTPFLQTDGYHGVGVEAAVGPHRELTTWRQRSAPDPTVSLRKSAAPRAVLARPSRSRAISTSPVSAAVASSGWIAALAGVASGGAAPSLTRPCVSQMVESRSMVNGSLLGPAPACQAPASSSAADPIQLADVAPPEATQERPQGGTAP